MINCGIIQPYEARDHNIKIFINLLEEWGLKEYAEKLSDALIAVGEGNLYDALSLIEQDNFLLKYFPSICEIASSIYASPNKASAIILGVNFIDAKDLSYYSLEPYSIECKTYFSLGFRDIYDSLFHEVSILNSSVNKEGSSIGRVLLKHIPSKKVGSLEDLSQEKIVFKVFLEKNNAPKNFDATIGGACPVCSISDLIIGEFSCRNTEDEVSKLIINLLENATLLAEEGEVMIGLR
jgi:hypothetical protein